MTSNAGIVVDQFTRQAAPFANSAAMRDADALRLLVEFSGAAPSDTVLDVACGPGLVVAAFARVAHHATGIDLTPAMIDKAREHAAGLALTNVAWHIGNVLPLAVSGSFVLAGRVALCIPSFSRSRRGHARDGARLYAAGQGGGGRHGGLRRSCACSGAQPDGAAA